MFHQDDDLESIFSVDDEPNDSTLFTLEVLDKPYETPSPAYHISPSLPSDITPEPHPEINALTPATLMPPYHGQNCPF